MAETPVLDGVLFVLARLLEFLNIGVIILFAVRGVPARYIYTVLLITLTSLTFFVISFLLHAPLLLSSAITLIAFLSVLYVAIRVLRKEIVDVSIPQGVRCPVCSAYVKEKEDGVIALRVRDSYIFFDSEEHLQRFLADFEDYKRLRGLKISREDLGKAYILKDGIWKEVLI